MPADQLGFGQLKALWVRAGGDPRQASTAAGIALAESGGNVHALNPNSSTGDYSVGLWQINYYGSLAAPRTKQFGPPDLLRSDALANARAAVAISNNGQDFSPWSTYKSGAYANQIPVGERSVAQAVAGANIGGVKGPAKTVVDAAGGVVSGVESVGSFLGRLADPNLWLRILQIAGGAVLAFAGLVLLARQVALQTDLPDPAGLASSAGRVAA